MHEYCYKFFKINFEIVVMTIVIRKKRPFNIVVLNSKMYIIGLRYQPWLQ